MCMLPNMIEGLNIPGLAATVAGSFSSPAAAKPSAPAARKPSDTGGAPTINNSLQPPTSGDVQRIGNALLLGA